MKNNINAISLFIAVVLVLTGCGINNSVTSQSSISATQPKAHPTTAVLSTTKDQSVSVSIQNGQHILHVGDVDFCTGISFPKFQSMNELQTAIQTGEFTEKALATMKQHFPKTEDGDVILPIGSTLYEPTLPTGYTLHHITMMTKDLAFAFLSEGNISSLRVFLGQETYDSKYESRFRKFEGVPAAEMEPERNAMVYYYEVDTFDNINKAVVYTVETAGGPLLVCEYYIVKDDDFPSNVSETIPFTMCVLGNREGTPFTITTNPEERWSLEEIAQLGIKPYVGTNVG